jgi:hypothetical protein
MALEGELNRVKSQNQALVGQLQVLNRNLNALLARVQQLSSAPGGWASDASTNLVTNVAGSLVTNAASATPAGAGSGAGSLSSASSVLPSLGDEEVNAEQEKREKPQVVIKAWSALVQDLVAPPAHVSEMRIVSNAPQADSVRIDVQAAKIGSLLKPRQDGDKGAVLAQSSGGYPSREFSQLRFEVWLNKNTTIPSVISVGALLRALIPDADKEFDYSRFVLNPNVKAAMMRRYNWIAATSPLCKALPVADNMNLVELERVETSSFCLGNANRSLAILEAAMKGDLVAIILWAIDSFALSVDHSADLEARRLITNHNYWEIFNARHERGAVIPQGLKLLILDWARQKNKALGSTAPVNEPSFVEGGSGQGPAPQQLRMVLRGGQQDGQGIPSTGWNGSAGEGVSSQTTGSFWPALVGQLGGSKSQSGVDGHTQVNQGEGGAAVSQNEVGITGATVFPPVNVTVNVPEVGWDAGQEQQQIPLSARRIRRIQFQNGIGQGGSGGQGQQEGQFGGVQSWGDHPWSGQFQGSF